MVYFREVQFARQWWVTLLLVITTGATLYGLFQQLVLGRPWGNHPVSNEAFLLIEGALVAFVIWIHLIRLETRVEDDALVIRYTGLWPTRRIPLWDISQARAVTYNPLLSCGGWGVRWRGKGMVYNARGNRGVEIELRDGRNVLIGSQRPDELTETLQSRMAPSG